MFTSGELAKATAPSLLRWIGGGFVAGVAITTFLMWLF